MLKGRKIMQHVGKALRGAGKAAQQAGLGGTVGEALRRLAKRKGAVKVGRLRRRQGKSSAHQHMA
jgi:hypothetical protein